MAQTETRGLIIDYSSAPSVRKTWTSVPITGYGCPYTRLKGEYGGSRV